MRRKDRLRMDAEWIDDALRRARVLVLAMNGTDGWPYAVPVNFGGDSRRLFFHGAPAGLKHELLARDPRVCFQTYADAELITADQPNDFSYRFRSVTGFGVVTTIDDPDEKIAAANEIMKHYEGPLIEPGSNAAKALAATWVARIDVEHISGKDHP